MRLGRLVGFSYIIKFISQKVISRYDVVIWTAVHLDSYGNPQMIKSAIKNRQAFYAANTDYQEARALEETKYIISSL